MYRHRTRGQSAGTEIGDVVMLPPHDFLALWKKKSNPEPSMVGKKAIQRQVWLDLFRLGGDDYSKSLY